MHAGKGNGKEGSWEGDDANMHFELMMDQFNILFNLVHRVCVQDVCHYISMHACIAGLISGVLIYFWYDII